MTLQQTIRLIKEPKNKIASELRPLYHINALKFLSGEGKKGPKEISYTKMSQLLITTNLYQIATVHDILLHMHAVLHINPWQWNVDVSNKSLPTYNTFLVSRTVPTWLHNDVVLIIITHPEAVYVWTRYSFTQICFFKVSKKKKIASLT